MDETMFDVPGTVEAVFDLEDITIIKQRASYGRDYHVFVDGLDTGTALPTLEEAFVYGVAHKYEGEDTDADTYFFRMIGAEDE